MRKLKQSLQLLAFVGIALIVIVVTVESEPWCDEDKTSIA